MANTQLPGKSLTMMPILQSRTLVLPTVLALVLALEMAWATNIACDGYDIMHRGIANADTAVGHSLQNSSVACCAACSATPGCSAWTWHKSTDRSMPLACWLMNTPIAPHGTNGSVTSGVRTPPLTPAPTPLTPPARRPPLGFKPNIVFILTDDQDITQGSMDAMPRTRSLFKSADADNFNFTNAFVVTPICCPSRASYLTGQYTHNHGTTQNSVPHGCASSVFRDNAEPRAYASYLKAAGYSTAFFGKYLNQYGTAHNPSMPLSHVPSGWDHWVGLRGNSAYYNYTLSIDGVPEEHGSDYAQDYLTNVLANRSTAWLRAELAAGASSSTPAPPLLLVVHPPAPHRPAEPAPQYSTSFAEHQPPRTPAWNRVGADKHLPLSTLSPMNATVVEYSDHIWRRRLRALQSVDDLVAKVAAELEAAGAMKRTVFLYGSDHGYHSGQWALPYCKMMPYEEDVRIPLFARLPPASPPLREIAPRSQVRVASPVLSIDVAPFLLDLAGFSPVEYAHMDGRSFLPLLQTKAAAASTTVAVNIAAAHKATDADILSRSFLVEYFPIPTAGDDVQTTTRGMDGWCTDADVARASCPVLPIVVDGVNNTWACVRTIRDDVPMGVAENSLYCEFWDGTGYVDASFMRARKSSTSNFAEYYDMRQMQDPWQLRNSVTSLPAARRAMLQMTLARLMSCRGTSNCTIASNETL